MSFMYTFALKICVMNLFLQEENDHTILQDNVGDTDVKFSVLT